MVFLGRDAIFPLVDFHEDREGHGTQARTDLPTITTVTSDSDCEVLEHGGFYTPRWHGAEANAAVLGVGSSVRVLQRPNIYHFTIADFTFGAPEPNLYLRQLVGESLPWLHNCGEERYPFREPFHYLQRLSLETGHPLPNSALSPSDHIRVDQQAFTRAMQVKYKVEHLGFDSGMWGGLQYFSSIIVDK